MSLKVVAWERWSLMRGLKYSDLSETKKFSITGNGRLQEVVAQEGSLQPFLAIDLLFFNSVGDCIVAVNEVSTVNVSHQQAVEALKAAGGVVTLVIYFF